MTTATIDTGDTVLHGKTGETWVVAYVEGNRLAWCGWPEGTADLADCTLVEKATPEARLTLLRQMADSGGRFAVHAKRALGEYVGTLYVASRVHHAAIWRERRCAGVPINSTWIDEAGDGETADFGDLWARIWHEIHACTGLILYACADDFPLKGALIEAGIAMAFGKPVFVVLPGVELDARMRPIGSWILARNVHRCADVDGALNRWAGR